MGRVVVPAVALAGIAALTFWWVNRPPSRPSGPPKSPSSAVPSAATPGPPGEPGPTVIGPQAGPDVKTDAIRPSQPLPGDDFLGDWLVADPSDPSDPANTLVIRREGERLVGLTRRSRHADQPPYRLELEPAGPTGLKGQYVPKNGGAPFPATAELTSGKKKLVIELAPPASEYFTSVFVRLGREEVDAGGLPPSDDGPPGHISGRQALDLVSERSEVRAFLTRSRAEGHQPHVLMNVDEEERFTLHVFEIVGSGAAAYSSTFNWYEVGKKDGSIRAALP